MIDRIVSTLEALIEASAPALVVAAIWLTVEPILRGLILKGIL